MQYPNITEDQIQDRCTKKVFARGEDYFYNEMIENAMFHGAFRQCSMGASPNTTPSSRQTYSLTTPGLNRRSPLLRHRYSIWSNSAVSAFFLSQVHPERATWPTVQRSWDAFLDAHSSFDSWLAAMIKFSKSLFAIQPRSMVRSRWHQRVDHVLRKLPTKEPRKLFSYREVDHPSVLVQAIVFPDELMGSFYDGCDIFSACYLADRLDPKLDQLHRQAVDLRELIARRRAATDEGNETPGA